MLRTLTFITDGSRRLRKTRGSSGRDAWHLLSGSALIALMVMLMGNPSKAAERCLPSRLDACKDTNALIWSKAFQQELKAFLSHQHGDYVVPGETVPDQALNVLGGPPHPARHFGGLIMFDACIVHNCFAKGAVVLDPAGQIQAMALLGACVSHEAPTDCSVHDTLSIFIRQSRRRELIVTALTDWAKSAITADNRVDPGSSTPPTRLDRVQIIDVTLLRSRSG